MRLTIFIAILLAVLGLAAGSCSKAPGEQDFDRGIYELKRGNHVRAKALLEKAITKRPGSEQNALAYNYLGIAAWNLGQYQAAQEAFEDCRRLSPTLMEPVYNLGVLLAASGDPARAAKLFEEASRMDERDTRALEQLGRLYADRRQWVEARRSLYAALDRAPQSARILTAIALVDLQDSGPQKAIESLVLALDKNSRYAPALFNLGVIYDNWLSDRSHARSYFKRLLSAAPKGPQADHARQVLERGDKAPPDAPPAPDVVPPVEPVPPPAPVTVAPIATPSAPAPRPGSADDVIRQATQRAEKGDMTGALNLLLEAAAQAARERRAGDQEQLLRTAAKVCFDETGAHAALGQWLLENGKAEAALRSFKQAVVLDRSYLPGHLGMARAALKTGEYDAAVVGFNSALKIDPRNADALWELAQLLDQQLKMKEKASLTYRDFELRFPKDPRSLQAAERARALAPPVTAPVVSAPPRATPLARPAATVSAPPAPSQRPAAPVVVRAPASSTPPRPARQLQFRAPAARNTQAAVLAFNQGAQYQQKGNWDQAIAYYIRALENDDKLTSAYYNLGLAYTTKGDGELAKDAYLRALQVQPDLVSARYNLALLYYQGRDTPAALALLQEVVSAKPDYAAAHYTLGLIYGENPVTISPAKEAYQRFLQLAPNDPSAAVVRQWLVSH
jgi:tetratricopeptide (TPR) repeat protein